MKEIVSFDKLYTDLKNSDSQEINIALEHLKKENKIKNIIAFIICIVIDVLFYSNTIKTNFLPNSMKPMFFIFLILFNIVIFTLIHAIFAKRKKQFNQIFKSKIINALINNFFSSTKYSPTMGVSRNIYNEGNYKEYYNRYICDDYISAKIDDLHKIQMSEIETIYRSTTRDSDGNTHTTNTTVFHGIFAKIELDKSIQGTLQISPNQLLSFDSKKLNMDSSEFEKVFDVFSTSKIIGMQLLTSDVMEDLLDFKNKHKMTFDIFINNTNIYLRFHCGSMFEAPTLKKGAFDEMSLKKYYDILNFTYSLSKRLIDIIHETEL